MFSGSIEDHTLCSLKILEWQEESQTIVLCGYVKVNKTVIKILQPDLILTKQ